MKQLYRGMLAAASVAVMVAGCTDRDGTPHGTPAGPGSGLEGARVSTRLFERLDVPGTPAPPFERERTLAGRFRNGVATDRGGTRLAEAAVVGPQAVPGAAHRPLTRAFEHTDGRSGDRHHLDVVRAAAGAPVSRVVAKVNGRTVVALDLAWERRGDAWVLTGQDARVFDGAGRELHFRADLTGTTLARSRPLDAAALAVARSLRLAIAPREAWAAQACWQEYADYILATALLALASEAVIVSPEKLTAYVAWTLAWEKWQRALNLLLVCLESDTNPFPIAP